MGTTSPTTNNVHGTTTNITSAPVSQSLPKAGTDVTGKVVVQLKDQKPPHQPFAVLVEFGHNNVGILHVDQLRGKTPEERLARLESLTKGSDVLVGVLSAVLGKIPGKTRIVLSERALDNAELVQGLIGTSVEGTVTADLDFGLVLDIGNGLTGLLHNTEIVDPSVLKSGKVTVKVLSAEPDSKRPFGFKIRLSQLAQLEEEISSWFGRKFSGAKVIGQRDGGFRVQLTPTVEGFLPGDRLNGASHASIKGNVNVHVTGVGPNGTVLVSR